MLNLSLIKSLTTATSLLLECFLVRSRDWNSDLCVGLQKMFRKKGLLAFMYCVVLPFQLKPSHKLLVSVECVHDIIDGEEDNKDIIDSNKSVSAPDARSLCGSVPPHICHLYPSCSLAPSANQLKAPLIKLISPSQISKIFPRGLVTHSNVGFCLQVILLQVSYKFKIPRLHAWPFQEADLEATGAKSIKVSHGIC